MGVLGETRLTFAQAAANVGVSPGAIRRWYDSGCRGHRLEAAHLGGRIVTSKEAVERFLKKLNPDAGESRAVAG